MLFCLTNLFLHFYQVSHFINHTPNGAGVFMDDALIQPMKTQRRQGSLLALLIADAAFYPGNP
jgi:hypothetical protein